MKPSTLNFVLLCAILMLNIVCTHFMVQQYFFENYANSLIFGALNIVLFPLALTIYKRDRKLERESK
ncbi:hypothetical protein D1B31_07225 [Neobacillus notoginsengisoli]|uniref:Uncharacterized protein n=1 Tax=Neobacillus notoginsengisoli TaxID=1578198 RepID=A0A417YVT4_9BACI|nr:hypothetical protein [Neobacillus notoginsengisoli]RHW41507.1 hypothetical protein D1B31_07225 [Neobacillus notoginsengisoli]